MDMSATTGFGALGSVGPVVGLRGVLHGGCEGMGHRCVRVLRDQVDLLKAFG